MKKRWRPAASQGLYLGEAGGKSHPLRRGGSGEFREWLLCRLWSSIPRPKAILCVSAHWYIPAVAVTAMPQPRTIHDFGGFPRELFEVQYPAPGSPELASRVRELLGGDVVADDRQWGLDHGTWSVLVHAFPYADIPIVRLSINETEPASFHYELGKKIAPLRDQGLLIVGCGHIVHNLHTYAWGRHDVGTFDLGRAF